MSVGCYATENSCGTDIFNEILSYADCQKAASTYSLGSLNCTQSVDSCGFTQVLSSVMTIELCLQVCNSNGFKFAGLCRYFNRAEINYYQPPIPPIFFV